MLNVCWVANGLMHEASQEPTSKGATGQALATLQADLLASQLETAWAAVALQIQAVTAQRQVAAGHVQAPDCPQLEIAALAVLVQTACTCCSCGELGRARPETPSTHLST